MDNKPLIFVDLFCGMGTIRMGFEQAGHECVYSVEWDKHKRRIYEVIFGNEPEGRDITTVRADDIPSADCWTFGAPCQDFSIAGIRAGMEGDRSSLVREVFRLVRETPEESRPEWLLYENVKGMLSSKKGWDYLGILLEMESLGYDIEWQLLNSKDFGVPQNRERVFTLGHSRRYGERKVFPIGGSNEVSDQGGRTGTLANQYCSSAVTKNYAKGVHSGGETYIQVAGRINSSQDGFVLSPDGISKTLTSGHFNTPKISIDLKSQKSSTRRGMYKTECVGALDTQCNVGVVITSDGIFPTETAFALKAGKHGPTGVDENHSQSGVQQDSRIRRLTPRECMRLQGVPDYITDKLIAAGISDTQLYRAAGDACTVNVIYEIARRLP